MTLEYRDSGESKEAGVTYHLAIVSEWNAQKASGRYAPSAYETDGFIHCTNGLELLARVANMFYRHIADERVVLVLDVARIEAPWRYDDDAETFPHIYGPLSVLAVIGELPVMRRGDGTFLHLGAGS